MAEIMVRVHPQGHIISDLIIIIIEIAVIIKIIIISMIYWVISMYWHVMYFILSIFAQILLSRPYSLHFTKEAIDACRDLMIGQCHTTSTRQS